MTKKLTVIPEQCSGCKICELVCSINHFGVNNPKKAAIRVIITYPHPVMRMPVVCGHCKVPTCVDVCPVDALFRNNGLVHLDKEACISCYKCISACPFGAIYAHEDCDYPIQCDMCGGDPECIKKCPKGALRLIPEDALGESKRLNNVLSYTQMKEIEFFEKGEKKRIHYAEIGKEVL
ncbi:MAG: 4Fe-4S dicluster domain-containing protein [Halobacteriota archaeon]|nr:4Fe-4S dicluster domain-containing protein [Halobacteriota archaeon]